MRRSTERGIALDCQVPTVQQTPLVRKTPSARKTPPAQFL